jgi:hypothetical protein
MYESITLMPRLPGLPALAQTPRMFEMDTKEEYRLPNSHGCMFPTSTFLNNLSTSYMHDR